MHQPRRVHAESFVFGHRTDDRTYASSNRGPCSAQHQSIEFGVEVIEYHIIARKVSDKESTNEAHQGPKENRMTADQASRPLRLLLTSQKHPPRGRRL